jgi:transcriptional regulator with XRE-family HTH domain
MSSTLDLVKVLKAEMKSEGITYAVLAREMNIAESTVKRIFAKGDMPLSRIDEVLRVLKMDFAELARKVSEATRRRLVLTLKQEQEIVADRKLVLMAICCLSQWGIEQIMGSFKLSEVDCTRCLTHLDRLGIIELRPHNRYRLRVENGFTWLPDGPLMTYFRERVVPDYFAGRFDGEGEMVTLVYGRIARNLAPLFNERLRRLVQDFAQQHLADRSLPEEQQQSYTLVLGMRTWVFSQFRDLKRGAG